MRPLSGAVCYPKWQVKGVLAAPVASPGPVGLCAAPWAPRSSAESSWLHLPPRMWLLLPGIFEEIKDRVHPSWKRVSDLAADLLRREGGRVGGGSGGTDVLLSFPPLVPEKPHRQ